MVFPGVWFNLFKLLEHVHVLWETLNSFNKHFQKTRTRCKTAPMGVTKSEISQTLCGNFMIFIFYINNMQTVAVWCFQMCSLDICCIFSRCNSSHKNHYLLSLLRETHSQVRMPAEYSLLSGINWFLLEVCSIKSHYGLIRWWLQGGFWWRLFC